MGKDSKRERERSKHRKDRKSRSLHKPSRKEKKKKRPRSPSSSSSSSSPSRTEPPAKKKMVDKRRTRSSSSSSSSESTSAKRKAEKRKRPSDGTESKQFQFDELEVLYNSYTKRRKVLEEDSKTLDVIKRKDTVWNEVAEEVSAVRIKRSGASCREKVKRIKSRLKLEEALFSKYRKKTGNFSDDQIQAKVKSKLLKPMLSAPIRELFLPILSTVQKEGIKGGVDTSRALVLKEKSNEAVHDGGQTSSEAAVAPRNPKQPVELMEKHEYVFVVSSDDDEPVVKDISLSQLHIDPASPTHSTGNPFLENTPECPAQGDTNTLSPAEPARSPTPPPYSPALSPWHGLSTPKQPSVVSPALTPLVSPRSGYITRVTATDILDESDVALINKATRTGYSVILRGATSGRILIAAKKS